MFDYGFFIQGFDMWIFSKWVKFERWSNLYGSEFKRPLLFFSARVACGYGCSAPNSDGIICAEKYLCIPFRTVDLCCYLPASEGVEINVSYLHQPHKSYWYGGLRYISSLVAKHVLKLSTSTPDQ